MCETKKCARCGRELPIALFGKCTKSPDGLNYMCKPCVNELQREAYQRKKAEKEERKRLTQEAVAKAPLTAEIVTTTDGRTLRRVIDAEHCKPLSEYKSREQLEEIKRRGYVWENMWVKTKVEYAKI